MPDLTVGEILDGRYEVLSLLGRGGMGSVYKARQLNLDRIVAIKVPSDRVLASSDYAKRFAREAHLCAKVADPHIVAIFDVMEGERPYFVMEYVDGMPLNQYLHEEATTLFVSDLLEIVSQVCEGLDAAHARHIIHRDIKPANIAIAGGKQQVKIMDFGVARASDAASMTTDGSMLGTPYYMAPEQVRGAEVGPATDLYALAGVVYYVLTGHHVFQGEVASLLYMHVSTPPVPPSRVNSMLPPEVDAVLVRALDKQPQARHGSCGEFCRELRKALRPLAHLPYSQMFPNAADRVAPTPPPPDAARTVSSPPSVSPTAQTKTLPAAARRSSPAQAASLPAHGADTPTRILPQRTTGLQPAAERPAARRRAPWAILTGVGLVVVVAVALGAYLLRHRPAPRPTAAASAHGSAAAPAESPAASLASLPAAQPAEDVAPPPSGAQAPRWLGRAPQQRAYRVGDYVTARWTSGDSDVAAVWVVEVGPGGGAAPLVTRRTADTKFALRLDRAGRFELTVRPEGGAPEAAALRAAFDVAPAAAPVP